MNEDLHQSLVNIKKQFATAIPVSAKKIAESPELKRIVENSIKAQETIPLALMKFTEAAAPYAKIANEVVIKIAPYLIQLAEVSARLNVISRLGQAEYVIWKSFPEEFYEKAYKMQTDKELLDCTFDWLKATQFVDVEATLKKLSENEYLKDNPVFLQAVEAYRRGDYDISVLGFTAMIDRLLSEYSGLITSTSIKNRVKAISEKIKKVGEASLDELELNDYILISTYVKTLELFGADSRFNEDEPDLNRHWIMHGRIDHHMEQMDCIRVINILFGTILMGIMSVQQQTVNGI